MLNAARIKQDDGVFGLQPSTVAPFGQQTLRTRLVFDDDGELHTTSPAQDALTLTSLGLRQEKSFRSGKTSKAFGVSCWRCLPRDRM